MGKDHLSAELLSALADGELDGTGEVEARAHLHGCQGCRSELATFARLDAALAQPQPLACGRALELRSALLDRELTAAEAKIARAHLAACAACSHEQSAWTAIERAIAALPAALPSTATDAAIAALTRQPRAARPRLAPPAPLGIALRGAVAAAVAVALLISLIPGAPAAPERATPAAPVLVAGVTQTALHSKSNTLYLLKPDAGAVDAVDAGSYDLRARIAVGGKPTSMALIESTDQLFVLDASAKTLTEIDANRNQVVASTPLDVAGTPTSLVADQANGKIVVASQITPPGGPAPVPTAGRQEQAGQVSVIDPATKQTETVQKFDVAPRLVVPDPRGRQTLLVSSDATTLVDASYRTVMTLPGGIGAAFDARGLWFGILAAEGSGTTLTFVGERAPVLLKLEGTPTALTALPGGGFGVLVAKAGKGRLHVIDADGRAAGSVEVGTLGSDLEYDPRTQRFTIAGGGTVASVARPATPVAVPESPSPSGSGLPVPEASASPGPSAAASPEPRASASPAPTPSATREVVAVPADAKQVAADLYRLALPDGRAPVLTATSSTHLWFLDQRNALGALDLESGVVYRIAQLPRDANVRALGVGPDYVYAADVARGRLFLLDLQSEILTQHALPATDVSAMTVTAGGVVWIAMPGSSQLLSFTPLSKRMQAVDVGVSGIVALAPETGGGVWFSTPQGIGSYDPTRRLVTRLPWALRGTAHVLLPGRRGTLWVGTSAGEILSVTKDGIMTVVGTLAEPVTALTLDPLGRPWYLSPALATAGFTYQPVNGSREARTVPGPALGLAFNSEWRTWLPDPSGGFFLGVVGPK